MKIKTIILWTQHFSTINFTISEEVDLIVSDNFTIAEVVDCKYFLMVFFMSCNAKLSGAKRESYIVIYYSLYLQQLV